MAIFALVWFVIVGVIAELSSESPTTLDYRSTSSRANTTIHTVTVGKGGYNMFVPNTTMADAGDIIQFLFYPQNHSVVKAEEGYPCIPYDTMNPGKSSFFSGFEYVPQVLSDVSYAPTLVIKYSNRSHVLNSRLRLTLLSTIHHQSTSTAPRLTLVWITAWLASSILKRRARLISKPREHLNQGASCYSPANRFHPKTYHRPMPLSLLRP